MSEQIPSPIRPFRPHFDIRAVERLHQKVKDTVVPGTTVLPVGEKPEAEEAGVELSEESREYGISQQFATRLWEYWVGKYSWARADGRIHQFDHFMTELEGVHLHFIHQRAKPAKDAIPLLLIHGWPGSFYEFSEVIKPLTETGEQRFHCVVPSLPGFCFSSRPPRRGWTVKDSARVLDRLMRTLGYEEYMVQAGGWGAMVARELGAQYSERCRLMHFNWCLGKMPDGVQLTEREAWTVEKNEKWRADHVGSAGLMRTRPQSVGWMLEDHPVGLMTLIGEKYEELSNPAVHDQPHWMDHILTTVSLYFHTRCIATSALLYYENPRAEDLLAYVSAPENLIKCPFGYTSMEYDSSPNSERAVQTTGNLVWYKERHGAGHFACLEAPQEMMDDVREVAAKFWRWS